ncbi:MAG TPA: hypothetical protein IGS17_00930 [Oscillatoriales cyanobacterium M59_W2019_021]|nr:MAG: hypothetical protein D6728_12095 [Cyanobacteria bacterium J055]HIK32004.1 hypothetical protein [Oscillatoriales cyanobacterium M4454_W2019_049]HIK49478.1 hypothetical protein [Oscillatoriales cyanobacterium M59_W2019_021]
MLCLWVLLWSPAAFASSLVERMAQFPNWDGKPPVEAARGDLAYPEWMAGTWTVTSTLVEMSAPLAPEVVTPGFEGNRQYLDRPMSFEVRFGPPASPPRVRSTFPIAQPVAESPPIVADRAFNGLNIARSYLGDAVVSVQVDPDDPNRQITALRGDRQLISIVSGRHRETPDPDRFVATELFNQVFRSSSQIYFNQAESTTAYRRVSPTEIEAEQMTAIYLSPQDPNYFKASDTPRSSLRERPVALYRYRLQLSQPSPERE